MPIPEVLPDAARWAPTVKLILALMAGDDAEDVSASGYADYRDTDNNWPVLSGYGALISAMARRAEHPHRVPGARHPRSARTAPRWSPMTAIWRRRA